MECIEPISRQPSILFQDDLRQAQRSYVLEHTCAAKSFSDIRSYETNFPRHFQNRGLGNKTAKVAKVSTSSCQEDNAISKYSYVAIYDGSTGLFDLDYEISRVDGPNNRSSIGNRNKKGELYKNPASSCKSDTSALDASVHEICTENCSRFEDKNEIAFDVFLQENIQERFDSWGISNDILDSSSTLTSVSYSDEDCESETTNLHWDFSKDYGHDRLGADGSRHQITDVRLSNFVCEAMDGPLNQSNDVISYGVFSNRHSACSLDSFSDGWNTESSIHGSYGVKFQKPVEEDNGISDSRTVSEYGDCDSSLSGVTVVRGPYGMSSNSSNGISNPNYRWSKVDTDRTKCINRGCSRIVTQSITSDKRGRLGGNLPGNSSGVHRLSGGENMHGWKGKENNHSVWQKVQKNDIGGYIYEPKNIKPVHSPLEASKETPCGKHETSMGVRINDSEKFPMSACLDEMAAQTEVQKSVSSVIESHIISLKSEDGLLKNNASEKLKRKPNSGSKQEHNNYPRKGPHPCKTDPDCPKNMNMQQKETLKPMIYTEDFGFGQSNRADCCLSEPVQNSHILSQEIKPIGNICSLVSGIHASGAQNLMNPLPRTSDSSGKKHLLEEQPDDIFKFQEDLHGEPPLLIDNKGHGPRGPTKLEIDVSNVQHSRQDHNSGSVIQKWVPVGRKDACLLDTSRYDNPLHAHLDEPVNDSSIVKSTEKEQSRSDYHLPFPLTNDGLACWSPDTGLVKSSSPKDEEQHTVKLRSAANGIYKESSSMSSGLSCTSYKAKDQSASAFETDSNMIPLVVNDAYKLQIESEGIQLVTGSPLAEFERLLYSASPVLEHRYCIQNCRTCLGDQLVGDSLCPCQTPNVTLGRLWQWYEGPGSYGLEVKTDDNQNPKTLGCDRFGFRAYFVPFLSAVQLFAHRRCCMCSSKHMEDADMNKTSENSTDLSHLPILSMLLPRPCREQGASPSSPNDLLHTSDPLAASCQDKFSNQSLTGSCSCDSELLFEYFDSEQPHQRRPLFDKIRELIRGDAPSNCQIFGNPSKLDCLHLRDLHPSSWYSVAWYPIYRIPDGNFQAAFLTYHSLGHFIRRSMPLDSLVEGTCIVSPVVGLQSYNAQGECWFELKNSADVQTESLQSNPSEILKERLKTLERTASVMARACVRKADQKSINRQPDYEFFLSRRQ